MDERDDRPWNAEPSQAPSPAPAQSFAQPQSFAASQPQAPYGQQTYAQSGAGRCQQPSGTERRVVMERGVDTEQRAAGIRNIFSGALLIAIGLAFGGSVLLGNADGIDYVFDGLGILWIGKGVRDLATA